MRAWGSRYARLVLERCKQNKREACKVLDISYHTLNSYLKYQSPDRPLPPEVVAGLVAPDEGTQTGPPAERDGEAGLRS